MRSLLLNNFWWKVTAFLLAVLAWLGFQPKDKRVNLFPSPMSTEYTRYLVAHPVTIVKPATDSREYRVSPALVDMTLSGDERVGSIWAGELRAIVDVTGFTEGTNSLPLTFVPPPGVSINKWRILPDRVQVEVRKESATVPVPDSRDL